MLKKWAFPARERLSAAFRADCLLCGTSSAGAVCPACEADLPRDLSARSGPELDAVATCFEYRFPVDRLVQRFKAGRDFVAGRWLADRLLERVAHEPTPDLVVAPPTPRARLAERGFNPALHLARRLSCVRGLRCEAGFIERVLDTTPQRGLDRAARRANVRGAFRCRGPVDGLRVALVDDVVTTGATAGEIAGVLRAAGAAGVVLWAVARTPAPDRD